MTASWRRLLLPAAVAASAAVLAASEFVTMFEFPINDTIVDTSSGGSRHAYALTVIAAFSLASLVALMLSGARPPTYAIAIAGVVALAIFLVVDVPDANRVGSLEKPEFVDSRAEPAAGFWLELVGAMCLTAVGAALATMREERLREMAGTGEDAPEGGAGSGDPPGSSEPPEDNPFARHAVTSTGDRTTR